MDVRYNYKHKKVNLQNKEPRKRTKFWGGWSSFSQIQFSRKSKPIKVGGFTYF